MESIRRTLASHLSDAVSFSSRFAFSLFARPLNPSDYPLGFIHCRDNECDSDVEDLYRRSESESLCQSARSVFEK